MLSEALTALAAAGGTALVGAMATDAWATARAGVTKLFHRTDSGRQTAVQTQLDNTVTLVEHAPDPDQARTALVGLWQMELSRLLDEHPDAEPDLTTLIAQIREELPAEQQLWVQNIIARDHGQAFGAQGPGAKVIVHQAPPGPGTAPGQKAGDLS